MMDFLHITSLRRGADGRNAQAPNAANYDEAKANPYPNLPDPLVLKNGQKVTTPQMWWDQRRPETVEDFDREIYGDEIQVHFKQRIRDEIRFDSASQLIDQIKKDVQWVKEKVFRN